jgi:hypothetical protein
MTAEIIRDILADPTARVRERRLAERVLELEEAIEAHHTLHYASGPGARAVFAPPDVALYRVWGGRWNKPPAWHPTPEQREAWRRDPDAAKRERAIEVGAAR